MNPKLIRYAERIVAILLSATVLVVFFVRATHAGGLWRDECDSLELARLPTFADVLHNLKFTSFPIQSRGYFLRSPLCYFCLSPCGKARISA